VTATHDFCHVEYSDWLVASIVSFITKSHLMFQLAWMMADVAVSVSAVHYWSFSSFFGRDGIKMISATTTENQFF